MLNLQHVVVILALSMLVLCNPKKVNILERACESLSLSVEPVHAAIPSEQTPVAPYKIEISKKFVVTGERLQITLKGKNEEDKFKGILVQARRVGTASDKVAVGKFIIGESGDGQLINCEPGYEVNLFPKILLGLS